jgi:hypothetical protein
MLSGALGIVAFTAMLAIALWVVFYAGSARLFVRRHLPAPTAPAGPPIEALAADLKRLRAATLHV